MLNVQIVTDSCAHFPTSHLPANVTVVPNALTIGGATYREGVDISADEALRRMAQQPAPPTFEPPSTAEYAEIYATLARNHDAILSIHASRAICASWANAKAAASSLAGHCRIEVIDSQTLSAAQGMLVRLAARTLSLSESLDDVIRVVRGAVERSYSVFFVDSMDYVLHNRILPPSQGILSMMLNLKPVLTVEAGRLAAMEKVRTRTQGIERMVEFAIEFTEFEDALIVQPKLAMTEGTRILQERLALEFPDRLFPFAPYGASLGALIGVDATGLVLLERESDRIEDDF